MVVWAEISAFVLASRFGPIKNVTTIFSLNSKRRRASWVKGLTWPAQQVSVTAKLAVQTYRLTPSWKRCEHEMRTIFKSHQRQLFNLGDWLSFYLCFAYCIRAISAVMGSETASNMACIYVTTRSCQSQHASKNIAEHTQFWRNTAGRRLDICSHCATFSLAYNHPSNLTHLVHHWTCSAHQNLANYQVIWYRYRSL